MQSAEHEKVDVADRVVVSATVCAFALGAALRVWLLIDGRGALTGDEAVVGLMARRIVTHHDIDAFFWGQHYGGTLEALLTAPFVALFGSTPLALRIVPTALFAGACALTAALGRRVLDARSALVAAALLWLWPANLLWFSTREWGFYGAELCLGLAFVLATLRTIEAPASWSRWVALAAVGGLAWWTSPQSLHFALPAIAWLVAALRNRAWRLVAVAPVAVLTAAPWFVHNVATGWASLRSPTTTASVGYLGNVDVFLHRALPVMLGLQMNGRWTVAGGKTVYWVVFVGLVVALVLLRRRLGVIALVLVAYPFVYAIFPLAAAVGEGRYTLYALPFCALLITLAARRPEARLAVLGAAAVLTVAGMSTVAASASPFSPDAPEPRSLGPLVDALEDAGAVRVWAAYHTAYRIDFESGGHVVAAANTDGRWRPYQAAVAASRRPAWVFPTQSRQGEEFRRGLDALREPYDTINASGYVAYWPHRRVIAADVLAAGRPPPPHAR